MYIVFIYLSLNLTKYLILIKNSEFFPLYIFSVHANNV